MEGIISTMHVLLETDSSVVLAKLCHDGISASTSDWRDMGWGCGYRNTQILLSSLLVMDPDQYRIAFAKLDMLSIKDIQAGIENAWNRGFDTEGAAQLRWKLSGTKKWIGATEVYAFLTSAGYDSLLVQFEGQNHVSRLMDYCESYFSSRVAQDTPVVSHHALNPLYLQHQGHSRTVVGFLRTDRGCSLLVLDPAKRVSANMKKVLDEWSRSSTNEQIKSAKSHDLLKAYIVKPRTLRKQQYQLLQVMSRLTAAQQQQRKVIMPKTG